MRTQFSKLALTATFGIALALTATTNAAVWNGTADTTWFTNHKTDTEFTITTAEQLAGLAKLVNDTTDNGTYNMRGKTIRLGADIMLNDTTNWKNWATSAPANKWVPIGDSRLAYYDNMLIKNNSAQFEGNFDGNGHIVSGFYGLYIYNNSINEYTGLFGKVYKSTIKNLGVLASYVEGGKTVGGLVGNIYGNGAIINSYFVGAVSGNKSSVGGLVGYNYMSTISNSYFTGTVTGTTTSSDDVVCAGGLVGLNLGMISGSYSTGTVTSNKLAGGLVCSSSNSDDYHSVIANSYSTSTVLGETVVAGLVGINTESVIINSYANGSVSGKCRVGGLVGTNNGEYVSTGYNEGYYNYAGPIINSYATGVVTAGDLYCGFGVGGLVGYNSGPIRNSYSRGSVSNNHGTIHWPVNGGLVGENEKYGSVRNSYSTGNVQSAKSGSSSNYIGGLVGKNDPYDKDGNAIYGAISNSYYNKETSKQGDEGKGDGKTSVQMLSREFVDSLNAEVNVMNIDASNKIHAAWQYNNANYPTLLLPAAVLPPTLASYTQNSITINAVPAPSNGQTVEYAIESGYNYSPTNWQTLLSANDWNWQTSLTFTGLSSSTEYYIFARSKENQTYIAGIAVSLRVKIDELSTTPIRFPQIAGATGNYAMQVGNNINLTVKNNAVVEIYGLKGNLISKQNYANGNHSVSLKHLPKGMYFVKVSFGNGTSTKILRATVTH